MPLDDSLRDAVNDVRLQAEELFPEHGNLTYVIGKIVLPTHLLADGHDHQTNTPFDFEGMLKLAIHTRVTGMSQEAISDQLENWPYLQQRFGLDGAPSQETISYTKRHRFEDLDTRHFLRAVADELAELTEEHDSTYSPDQPPDSDPSPEEVAASGEPIHHYVDRHAKHVITGAQNEVWPVLDTGRADNTKHADRRVWEHQTAMSLSKRAGTHSAFRTFNKFRRDALHHDTHLYAVQMLGLPDDHDYDLSEYPGARLPTPDWRDVASSVMNQFNAAVDRQMANIAPTALFTEPVVAALDTTHDPFNVSPWKDEEDIEPEDDRIAVGRDTGRAKVPKDDYPEMVNGGEDSHTYQYEYATLTVVGRNAPIVLAVEPVRHDSTWEGEEGETVSWAEVVDRLLTQARKHVDIQLVMADRAFDGHAVGHVIDQYHDVNYLIPKKKNATVGGENVADKLGDVKEDMTLRSRVERDASLYLTSDTPYVDVADDPTVGEDGYSHDASFLYVPAEDEDWAVDEDNEYAVFVTNADDVSPMEAIGLSDEYSKRWDIEIEYKMVKPLLPSIRSTDYRMRFFTFAYSLLLYNLWRMVDHSLKTLVSEVYDEYGRGPHEERLEPLLTLADLHMTVVALMLLPDGVDPPF
jgi:IS4 transposase